MIFRIQYISYYIYVFIYILPSIYRPWRAVSSDSALIFRSQPVFFPCLQYLHFIKIRISHKFTKSDCYMQFTNRLRLRQGWDTFPTPPHIPVLLQKYPLPSPSSTTQIPQIKYVILSSIWIIFVSQANLHINMFCVVRERELVPFVFSFGSQWPSHCTWAATWNPV